MSSDGQMTEPDVAQKGPLAVDVKTGSTYWWFACGRSQRQPFCDGSHKGAPFQPVEYRAAEGATVWLCGCNRTSNRPFRDGPHEML